MNRARFPTTVHLFFIRDGQILLSRRLNTGYRDGEYSVPAGHLDGGETVTAAGCREALEEVGVALSENDLTFAGVMHRMEDEERVDFFFVVRAWPTEPFNNEPAKCDDVGWFELKALPDNTVPYVRQAIQNHLEKRAYAEFSGKPRA